MSQTSNNLAAFIWSLADLLRGDFKQSQYGWVILPFMVNYAYTIRDKVSENELVMKQIANNSSEQAMLGDFTKSVDDAVMDSSDAHKNQIMQLLSDPAKAQKFAKVVFDLLTLAE